MSDSFELTDVYISVYKKQFIFKLNVCVAQSIDHWQVDLKFTWFLIQVILYMNTVPFSPPTGFTHLPLHG